MTAVKLERYVASIYIFSIIIIKLGYWQGINLVILLKVDKNSKVKLYYIAL